MKPDRYSLQLDPQSTFNVQLRLPFRWLPRPNRRDAPTLWWHSDRRAWSPVAVFLSPIKITIFNTYFVECVRGERGVDENSPALRASKAANSYFSKGSAKFWRSYPRREPGQFNPHVLLDVSRGGFDSSIDAPVDVEAPVRKFPVT